MAQAVLRKFVLRKLSPAIPVDLKTVEEFAIGMVLVHPKKPQKVIPMRGHDLISTGVFVQSLLAQDQQLSISMSMKLLFDTGKDERSGHVDVDMSDDPEFRAALMQVPELKQALQSAGDKKKTLHISADLGSVQQISTDLVHSIATGSIQVQLGHPVVKKAMENGGALFVIGATVGVDRCNVSVKVAEGDYTKVISHDQPLTLAYKLMKANVDSNGVVTSVLNKQLKSVASIEAPVLKDQPDGSAALEEEEDTDQYLYSIKDFQPFESISYNGILEEAKAWVAPLLLNRKLQDALLTYTKPPRTYERLNELSSYFLDVGNAMRSKTAVPQNKVVDIDPIIDALSKEHSGRLDEITAVIIVAEAADEFPQHIVQMIIDLPLDKRQLLLDLILETPYGSSRHVYADEGPYKDPVLKPILSRMGFSIPANTHNLLHARRDFEDEEDTLTAAIVLMLGSAK